MANVMLTPDVLGMLTVKHLTDAEAGEVSSIVLSRPAAFADAINISKGRKFATGEEVARFVLKIARDVAAQKGSA